MPRRALPMLLLLCLLPACSADAPAALEPSPTSSESPAPTRSPVELPSTLPIPVTHGPAEPASPTDGPATGSTYVFPVRPAKAATYGRSHHDYPATDIFAACGTSAVSPVSGVVDEVSRVDAWRKPPDDGATRGGLSVSVVGDDGVRYYGSHLRVISAGIASGVRVSAGEQLGEVGSTGSARGTACHLHFGISPPRGPGDWQVRRGVVYPWPYLDSWKTGGQKSPAAAVDAWAKSNP